MKSILTGAALFGATAAVAQGRAPLGEVWVYPSMFEQSLGPLAELGSRVGRESLCPDLAVGADKIIHTYSIDVKMKARGVDRQWEVTDLRLENPSGCDVLDTEFARYMKGIVGQFAEPYKDLNKDGWTRIPKIQLRLVD